MNHRKHKAKLMLDSEFRAEYKALRPEYKQRREEIRRRIEDAEDLADAEKALEDYTVGGDTAKREL